MANADPAARPATPPPDDEDTPEYREWLAAAYDTDVYEQWLRPFEELLHKRLEPLAKGMALEVGCATGRGTERLMKALGDRTRLVAQEDRTFLLDLARARFADHVGSRLFFNSDPLPKLRYDGKVFSTVLSNLSWWERTDRAALLGEMVRVLDDDGVVVLTAPLAGTFGELIDLTREVAVKLDLTAKLEPRIASLEQMFLTPEDWTDEIEAVGLVQARVDCTEVELRFGSSRELFGSTVAQARWVGLWKRAFGDEDQRLVWHVRQMIDSYWADGKFPVTIAAGCLTARRPRGFAAQKSTVTAKPVELSVPVVLAGESDVDRAPARPASAQPRAARDPYYASGDAIAADLLETVPEDDGTLADPAEDVVSVEAEPTSSEPGDLESVDAEPIEPASEPELEALEADEPYIPDEGDLHSPGSGRQQTALSEADLDAVLDDGNGVESSSEFTPYDEAPAGGPSVPPVAPVPLGQPRAAPVRPLDLGTPQIRPVRPVELDAPNAEPEEIFPDWEPKRRR